MYTEELTLSTDRTELLFRRAGDETARRRPALKADLPSAEASLLSDWRAISPTQSPELTSEASFSRFIRGSLRSRHGEERTCAIEFLATLGILTARADLRQAFDRTSAIYAVQ